MDKHNQTHVFICAEKNIQAQALAHFLSSGTDWDCQLLSDTDLSALSELYNERSTLDQNKNSCDIVVLIDSTSALSAEFYDCMEQLYQVFEPLITAYINQADQELILDEHSHPTLMGSFASDTSPQTLVDGIRAMLNGELWLSRQQTASLIKKLRLPKTTAKSVPSSAAPRATVSSREWQILAKLVEGKSNGEIADSLFLSENTIKSHLYRIYKKIDAKSRSQAIHWFQNQNA